METVSQVSFNLMSDVDAQRTEMILRQYLLEHANQVSMMREGSSPTSLFTHFPHPLRSRKFLQMLSEGDVAEKTEQYWTFNLTDNIKQLLNRTTLLKIGEGVIFYGFTDPKFTKNGNEIAYLLENGRVLHLFIPDSDKAELAAKGVNLDTPETLL